MADAKEKVIELLKGGLLEARRTMADVRDERDRLKMAADIINNGLSHPSAIFEVAEGLKDSEVKYRYETALGRKIAHGDSMELIDFTPQFFRGSDGFDLNSFIREKVVG